MMKTPVFMRTIFLIAIGLICISACGAQQDLKLNQNSHNSSFKEDYLNHLNRMNGINWSEDKSVSIVGNPANYLGDFLSSDCAIWVFSTSAAASKFKDSEFLDKYREIFLDKEFQVYSVFIADYSNSQCYSGVREFYAKLSNASGASENASNKLVVKMTGKNGGCWVIATNADGKIIFSNRVEDKNTYTLNSNSDLRIRIGDSSKLSLFVNDKSYDLQESNGMPVNIIVKAKPE